MAVTRANTLVSNTPAGLLPRDISNEVMDIRPQQTTLLTVLMLANKVKVDSREFKINEQAYDPTFVTVLGAPAPGSGTFSVSVADAALLNVGTILRLDVTTSVRVLTVDYGTGAVTIAEATTLTASDQMLISSYTTEEFGNAPAVITRTPDQIENYVETRRDTYGFSRFTETEFTYGGTRDRFSRRYAMEYHKIYIDRQLWFGKKVKSTINSNDAYWTNGILESITTNRTSFAASTVDWPKIRTNIENHTRFSKSSTLWLFVSRHGSSIIDQLSYTKLVPSQIRENKFGIWVQEIVVGNKLLKIFEVDHFEAAMSDTMCLIDPEFIEVVTCRNQKTGARQWMMDTSIPQASGEDGEKGVITSDFGLKLHNEQAHAIWEAATTAG